MLRNVVQIGSVLALAALLGSGVVAVCSQPARAQTTEPPKVTCWAESCEGNVCVRIKIQCPKEIIPVATG